MANFSIDLETFSPEDIKRSGLYRYASNPEFDILLFGYSLDGKTSYVLDCTRTNDRLEMLEIAPLLYNPAYIKKAWNAAFEWYCLSVYLNRYGKLKGLLPIDQWRDTQLQAQYLGYPSSLEKAGAAIGIPEDKKKLGVGKTLIRTFCSPRKPTKRDNRTRVLPADEPEKWELFKTYNAGDVTAEMTIGDMLSKWEVPDFVQKQWELDTMHNALGVNVDLALVDGALRIAEENTQELLDEAAKITGLDNPNSRNQLCDWLTKELPEENIQDLRRETVSTLLKGVPESNVKRVLEIRQETGKAAHKKYAAIKKMVCPDGRLRGLMKFYGANRTGRWASVGVQLQNLARTHLNSVDFAREIVEAGDTQGLRFCYGAVSDTLGQLVRTALIPSPGHVFVDADFSAIEARVIAWLAGEEWVLNVFRTHGKIYEATASQMFGVPMEKIKKGNPEYELRQRGKVATLACIAEGSLVPVKFKDGSIYEMPIQLVTPEDLVWDGTDWVRCEGAVFNGYREVITYEGLTATPDHLVWVEGKNEPIPFGLAAQSGAHLAKSGTGRFPVWVGKNHKSRASVHQGMVSMLRADGVSGVRSEIMDVSTESDQREIQRMPSVLAAQTNSEMAGPTDNSRETALPESERPWVRKLRGAWNRVSVWIGNRVQALHHVSVPESGPQYGTRQNRQQRSLRAGEHSDGYSKGKLWEQKNHGAVRLGPAVLALFRNLYKAKTCRWDDTGAGDRICQKSGTRETQELARNTKTVRVYDIRNAGPNHRYAVQGVIVHNCGYGGGAHAMETMDINHAIDPELYPGLVKKWRDANPAIVKYWYDTERAALETLKTGQPHTVGYCTYAFESDQATNQWFLTCLLPSGRKLFYVRPSICENRFGKEAIRFWGINDKKKWSEIDTYGGRLVENQCQAVARDCLAEKLWPLEQAGYPVVFSIHDEIVADAPRSYADLKTVTDIMAAPIPWAPGLPLNAEGWVGDYFRKD